MGGYRDSRVELSRENVELVKALIPQGDIIPLVRNEDAWARARDVFSPMLTADFESVIVLPGDVRTAPGPEGFRKNWLDWLEPWASYRVTLEKLIDAGDRIVALLRNYGRRADMETEVELIAAAIVTLRAGKVERWEDYADRADALAAGLPEDVRTFSVMPGWDGTLAQRASIALGAFYVLTGVAGLIVNPDFGTGASTNSELFLVDWNGWHAVLTLLLAATAFAAAARRTWATGFLAYNAVANSRRRSGRCSTRRRWAFSTSRTWAPTSPCISPSRPSPSWC